VAVAAALPDYFSAIPKNLYKELMHKTQRHKPFFGKAKVNEFTKSKNFDLLIFATFAK
jgi:hypothetical protein